MLHNKGIFLIWDGCPLKNHCNKQMRNEIMYKQYIKIISFAFICSVYNSNVSAQSKPGEPINPDPRKCFKACLSDIVDHGKECLTGDKEKFSKCVENTEASYHDCIEPCI